MSGRRRTQVAEDARLLGQGSFIYEAGACVVLDGEEHWLTGELLPGELTIAEQIERSGAPALLLEHYAGRLEYHEPWHVEREVSHLFRGLVDAAEVDALLAEHGHGDLRLVDNGVVSRRSPALAGAAARARLPPASRPAPPRRARSRFHRRVRAATRARRPSRSATRARTSPVRREVGTLLARRQRASSATPRCARRSPGARTSASPRPATAPGVYEAVVTTLMALEAPGRAQARRRGPAPSAAATGAARSPAGAPAPQRRRRHGRAHQRDPVVERQLAGDQPAERARHRAPTPARSSARASSGTDSSASTAWPTRSGISAAGTPAASSSPARRLRLSRRQRGRHEVAGAGQPDHRLGPRAEALGVAPDLGEDVPGGGAGGVQPLRLGRAGRERRGVLGGARELDADRVVGLLADDAGAGEHAARATRASSSSLEAATSAAPACTISWACAGPPRQATRSAPKRSLRTTVGGSPSGGTSPLATETTAVRLPEAGRAEAVDHLAEAARGHRQEHVVGARHAPPRRPRRAARRAARRPGR